MKRAKQALCAVLAAGLVLSSLAGCGEKEEKPSDSRGTEGASEPQGTGEASESEAVSGSETMEEVVFSGPEDKGCDSYVIPDGVTKIADEAFKDCFLLNSVEIPDSVLEINYGAFCICSGLTRLKLPANKTVILEAAFKQCSNLASIEIPEGGNYYVSMDSFSGCSAIETITAVDDTVVRKFAEAAYLRTFLEKLDGAEESEGPEE